MIEVLIISQGSAFTVDSLERGLRKGMVYTLRATADIESVQDNISGKGSVILIYGGDYLSSEPEFCEYIRTICGGENERTLGVVGYEKDIEAAEEMIGSEYISFKVKRPFDMTKLIEIIKGHGRNTEPEEIPEEFQMLIHPDKHSILLCDDDVVFLKMMQDRLSPKYNVISVKSGMQVILYIARRKPDLILLDYDMPITSGPQVMEMIRSEENSKDIPIVFLTGKSDRESVLTVMRLKPTGYLLKSTDKDEIISSIDIFFRDGTWRMVQS